VSTWRELLSKAIVLIDKHGRIDQGAGNPKATDIVLSRRLDATARPKSGALTGAARLSTLTRAMRGRPARWRDELLFQAFLPEMWNVIAKEQTWYKE
jgi:hypothetical protein